MSNNEYSSELAGYNSNNSNNLKTIYRTEKNVNRLLLTANQLPGYNTSPEFLQRMSALSSSLERARRRRHTRNVSRSTTPTSSRPSTPVGRKRKNRKTRKSRK